MIYDLILVNSARASAPQGGAALLMFATVSAWHRQGVFDRLRLGQYEVVMVV